MTRNCPKCEAETNVGPVVDEMRCRNCGARWKVDVVPPEGSINGPLGAFLADLRRLDAVADLRPAADAGGSMTLTSRGISVEVAARTDADLVTGGIAALEQCLLAIGRRPA